MSNSKLLNKFLVIFIFIDILLLPNFKYFVMPISLPLVLWVIFTKRVTIQKDREFLLFLILSILVLVSVCLSFLQVPNYLANGLNVWLENIKRAFQLITSFAYYFLIRDYLNKYPVKIKNILLLFVFFYVILGIISMLNIGVYFGIKEFLGIRDPFMNPFFVNNNDYLFRYSYLFIDPNNSAYLFQMVTFYLLLNEKLNITEKLLIFLSIIFSLILSMSTGAVLSLIVFVFLSIILRIRELPKIRITYKKLITTIITPFILIIIFYFAKFLLENYLNHIANYSMDRMLGNTDGGRLNKYGYMFGNSIPNLIGEGYTLIRDSVIFRPHSDQLRFLYSYGIVAYLIAIWFFFRGLLFNAKYLFLIPAFFAFSINSLIDEQKLLISLLILLAYLKTIHLIKRQNKQEGV
ncbi:hypothetical protein [Peribacillus aracenensis]|uniref:hypothetical protein n=1 Tax=Peribacillus aracenensis TaxID=2976708 RepID=UPI0021A2DBA8|nr:hypothetical protein [Peribacillus sp. BBB004]